MKPLYPRVMCATDLSELGDASIRVAVALAAPDGDVHVLHVCEPLWAPLALDGVIVSGPETIPTSEAEREEALRRLRRRISSAGDADRVRVEPRATSSSDPVQAILDEAERLHVDAIVLGTHGRTGFGRALMGSVSSEVAKRAHVPVVLLHDRRPRDEHTPIPGGDREERASRAGNGGAR